MEIGGLPSHVLLVHAAVVLIPMAASLVIAFALLPKWRWLSRWPTALAVVGALGLTWLTRISGRAFLDARPDLEKLVETHIERGNLLSLLMIPFAVLVLVGAWSLAGTSALASGRGHRDSRVPAMEKWLPVILVLASLAIIAITVLTGDAGSRAVWDDWKS